MNREITLMRHGQPNLAVFDKVSARDMQRWIEQYDLSEIIDQPAPEYSPIASCSVLRTFE